MASIGERLSQERQAKGLSIEDVSRATKIQPKYIQALEQEDFCYFSAPVYLKGFLRTYAQYLGLDLEEILSSYREIENSLKPPPLHFPFTQTGRSPRFSRSFYFLLLLVLLLIFLIYRGRSSKTPPKEFRAEEGMVLTLPNNVEEQQGLSVKYLPSDSREEALVTPSPSGPPPELITSPPKVFIPQQPIATEGGSQKEEEQEERLVLTAEALEDTWLRVVADDGLFKEDILLRKGKVKEWKAKEKFVLIIGHVAGTRIRLNGREIPLPHTRTDVLRDFTLTRANLEALNPSDAKRQ